MKTICFFNNKGGVGKTTLACNVASYIATHAKLRVLLIDGDPQCNATQLILKESEVESLYGTSTSKAGTLYEVLEPIAEGESKVSSKIPTIDRNSNSFRIDLLPGNPKISLLEDKISQAWINLMGADLGAARITNWMPQVLAKLEGKYDVVFIDVGPSLGALNRSILIGADYFFTPLGCDIFSIIGIRNISSWLQDWEAVYADAYSRCLDKWGDKIPDTVRKPPNHIARFIGYTVQQYITKSKAGVRRPTAAYEKIIRKIPLEIRARLHTYLPQELTADDIERLEIPHMFSLVPHAQSHHVPIHKMDSSSGLVGAQYAQRHHYVAFISRLSESISKNASLEAKK